MITRRLQGWQDLGPWAETWNAWVLGESPSGKSQCLPSVYQTFEWNDSWWQAFGGPDAELLLLASFEEEALVGVAPLCIRSIGKRRIVRFIGSENFASDFVALICSPTHPQARRALLLWLRDNPGLWDELDFYFLPGDSADILVLRELFGLKTVSQLVCDAPTRLLLNRDEDQAITHKKSLKRHHNWFARQGALTTQSLATPELILPELDAFFSQHIARRSLTTDPSQFLDPRQKDFYRDLVTRLAPKGWLGMFRILLDGIPVAQHIGFTFAQRFYWYKPAFAIEYAKHSPGEVLLKALFENALALNLREFDFTAGSESFKYRFANHSRKLYRLKIYRHWSELFIARIKQFVLGLYYKWGRTLGRRLLEVARRLTARKPLQTPSTQADSQEPQP